MPAEYKKLGIAFQYPENWTLDESDALAGRRAVTVYSPGGGFWSISVHPRSADPAKLASAAAETMQTEYEGVETEEAREILADHELSGYDFNFFYLDLTNTAAIRCLRGKQGTYAFFCQAEDREFVRVQLVFQAMTVSFLRNVEPHRDV